MRIHLAVAAALALAFGVAACSDTGNSQSSTSEATDAPAKATASPAQIRAMVAYWGSVTDVYDSAVTDAVNAYDPANSRDDSANYLDNCATMAENAKAYADSDVPDGWGDVHSALNDGLGELETRCTEKKVDLYNSDSSQSASRSEIARAPSGMKEALRLARQHMRDAGGKASRIRLAGAS